MVAGQLHINQNLSQQRGFMRQLTDFVFFYIDLQHGIKLTRNFSRYYNRAAILITICYEENLQEIIRTAKLHGNGFRTAADLRVTVMISTSCF